MGAPAGSEGDGGAGRTGADGDAERVRVLFVCLGNICRSPTAEGVMRALVRDAGLQERIEIDSAGTGAWHIDEPPDARATAAARERGVLLEGRARQVQRADFVAFDLIVAMDRSNLADLRHLAPDDAARAKLRLLRDFDPRSDGELDVPDPYHGGARGFEHVFDLVRASCAALLVELRAGLHTAR
ncbi:MAG TPA: low molecular weight protein-tyrosine-phosphatase [Solirubrobacteraceae bacterium]|nr:low molecular weight protein-tyrosine-phosphatase [Solirubrobacteraceae bacterium]